MKNKIHFLCCLFPHRNCDFVEHGQDKQPYSPYTGSNYHFRQGRPVFCYSFEHIWHETAYDQAKSLVNPEGDEKYYTGERQNLLVLPETGKDQETEGSKGKYARRPHQGNEFCVAIDSGIQVFERLHMAWYIAVEGGEEFQPEQEDICEHRIGNNLP